MSHVAKSAEFSLTPSRYTFSAKLGLTIASGLLVAVLPILPVAKIAGLLFLFAVGLGLHIDFRRQCPERLFVVDGDADCWRLVSSPINKQDGREVTVDLQLEPSQFVTVYLVILYFRTQQGDRVIRIIPRGSLSGEEHRILRKLLLVRTVNG
jgi:hypothetical protein